MSSSTSQFLKDSIYFIDRTSCNEELWTPFFDRDNPTGKADSELLSDLRNENPGKICDNPTAIDARKIDDDTDYAETGQNLTVNATYGLLCVNEEQQPGAQCFDYKVRFCCPPEE